MGNGHILEDYIFEEGGFDNSSKVDKLVVKGDSGHESVSASVVLLALTYQKYV